MKSKRKAGMGSHHSKIVLKDEWLTPPDPLSKLGEFDLDPCAPIDRPWDTAVNHFTIEDDGLNKPWFGRVWCNPPYGKSTGVWLDKLSSHNNGIALIFARTETSIFDQFVWARATGLLFIRGRLHFHHVDGSRSKMNAGAPSVLVAFGKANAKILDNSGINGIMIWL